MKKKSNKNMFFFAPAICNWILSRYVIVVWRMRGMEILISKVKSHLETPFSRFAFTSNADDQGRSGLAD